MPSHDPDQTIQKTQWTDSLLQDLCSALKTHRDDETVRAFARELMDDKDLPLSYLVRKVKESVGAVQAERLDVLIRGRHAVDREKKAKAGQDRSSGGVMGLVRKFLK